VLSTMFFPRMRCQSCCLPEGAALPILFFPECAVNHVVLP
jgi:hypothetical protein